jgi:hypothetical protein
MLRVADTGLLSLSVSIGIASNTPTTRGWERLLSHANDAMYEAKRAGKDRAVVHQEHIQQLMNALRAPESPQAVLDRLPLAALLHTDAKASYATAPVGRPSTFVEAASMRVDSLRSAAAALSRVRYRQHPRQCDGCWRAPVALNDSVKMT